MESTGETPSCEAPGRERAASVLAAAPAWALGLDAPRSTACPDPAARALLQPGTRSHRERAGCQPRPHTPGAPNGCTATSTHCHPHPSTQACGWVAAPRCAGIPCPTRAPGAGREPSAASTRPCSGFYRYTETFLAKHLRCGGMLQMQRHLNKQERPHVYK